MKPPPILPEFSAVDPDRHACPICRSSDPKVVRVEVRGPAFVARPSIGATMLAPVTRPSRTLRCEDCNISLDL